MSAPNTWPIGARIAPTHDTQICKYSDAVRILNGPDAPQSIAGSEALSKRGACSVVFSPETLKAFGTVDRVVYTYFGLFEEDLIVVIQTAWAPGENYGQSTVGFARAQDFELVLVDIR